jgi:hypothetical protein
MELQSPQPPLMPDLMHHLQYHNHLPYKQPCAPRPNVYEDSTWPSDTGLIPRQGSLAKLEWSLFSSSAEERR